jgi:hypothetical protein
MCAGMDSWAESRVGSEECCGVVVVGSCERAHDDGSFRCGSTQRRTVRLDKA